MDTLGLNYNNTQFFYTDADTDISSDRVIALGTPNKLQKIDNINQIANIQVKFNIEKLKDHPSLSFIKVKLNELGDNVIATNGNDATKIEYVKFYNTTFEELLNVLKNAHKLYWFNEANFIRSEYSFEECFRLAINLGLENMKLKNIQANILFPSDLLQNEASYAYQKRIKDNKSAIGTNYEKKSVKSRGSKTTIRK